MTDAQRPRALALSYARKDKAPVVVAKGYGDVAEAIVRTARESGVYVHAAPELLRVLMRVDLDREIPESLYLAVAEVMAWVARVDARVAAAIGPAAAP